MVHSVHRQVRPQGTKARPSLLAPRACWARAKACCSRRLCSSKRKPILSRAVDSSVQPTNRWSAIITAHMKWPHAQGPGKVCLTLLQLLLQLHPVVLDPVELGVQPGPARSRPRSSASGSLGLADPAGNGGLHRRCQAAGDLLPEVDILSHVMSWHAMSKSPNFSRAISSSSRTFCISSYTSHWLKSRLFATLKRFLYTAVRENDGTGQPRPDPHGGKKA